MADEPARAALAAIDTLLADRPEKIGHDFSEATRRLTEWRAHCIVRWRETRAEGDRQRLDQVNAAISVVLGGQFPLGPVNWDSIESVRRVLGAQQPGRTEAAGRNAGIDIPLTDERGGGTGNPE